MSIGNYDDAMYRTKSVISFPATGSLAGTAAAAAYLYKKKCPHAMTVADAAGYYVAGGTDAGVEKVVIGKSVAGTGTVTGIGTMTIGTQATAAVSDITITETDFDAGDVITLQRAAGTSAIVANVIVDLVVREKFTY